MYRGVAIALGGGGARGIAHVLALEALDEVGVHSAAIAGTSMGACRWRRLCGWT
jgi:NTE family protein